MFAKENKKVLAIKSLTLLDKISGILPLENDTKKEIAVLDELVREFTKKDDIEKSFLILLQNNMELRPGGGFLGQYAIVKIKNGEITSTYVEDANLLDQRIKAKIPTPYPFQRMMQLKKWKFRDSNFSPDFPTNVEKAKYFMRLSGRSSDFDGVIAVNADVLTNILELTGPVDVPGYGTFESSTAVLKLEEKVEKIYLLNPEIDTQNRKAILKKMAPIIMGKLMSLGNITKLAEFGHKEMQNKNIMLSFKDSRLQDLVDSVHWSGRMVDWGSDYLMLVDANMGSLKTDYYMRREILYDLDLTGEKPVANLFLTYKNTAPYGDWRTSDYHSYFRIYVPEGSTFLEREMASGPYTGQEFGKTFFGFIEHTVMGTETKIRIKYELPERIKNEPYKLLIQKQSGIGNLPVKVRIKTKDGEFTRESVLDRDLKFEIK